MWSPLATSIFIGCLFVVLIGLDVVLAVVWGNEATLSKSMLRISQAFPIVIVAWGGLSAHFFLPKDGHWDGWWNETKPVVALVIGFVAFRLFWAQTIAKV